jgi:hypothetical protein
MASILPIEILGTIWRKANVSSQLRTTQLAQNYKYK